MTDLRHVSTDVLLAHLEVSQATRERSCKKPESKTGRPSFCVVVYLEEAPDPSSGLFAFAAHACDPCRIVAEYEVELERRA